MKKARSFCVSISLSAMPDAQDFEIFALRAE